MCILCISRVGVRSIYTEHPADSSDNSSYFRSREQCSPGPIVNGSPLAGHPRWFRCLDLVGYLKNVIPETHFRLITPYPLTYTRGYVTAGGLFFAATEANVRLERTEESYSLAVLQKIPQLSSGALVPICTISCMACTYASEKKVGKKKPQDS